MLAGGTLPGLFVSAGLCICFVGVVCCRWLAWFGGVDMFPLYCVEGNVELSSPNAGLELLVALGDSNCWRGSSEV